MLRPMSPDQLRIAFLAAPTEQAQQALAALTKANGQVDPEDADILCALGGDGFMLQTLHRHGGLGKPVYGMKLGTVGFLMNHFHGDDLLERIRAAEPAVIEHALKTAQHRCGPVGDLPHPVNEIRTRQMQLVLRDSARVLEQRLRVATEQ